MRLFASDEGTDGPDALRYIVRAVPVILLPDRQDDDLGRDVLQLSVVEPPQDVLCSVSGYSKVGRVHQTEAAGQSCHSVTLSLSFSPRVPDPGT